MRLPRVFFISILAAVFVGGLSFISARDACTALLQETMRQFLDVCANTRDGQVCYGHPDLTLEAFGSATLNEAGDLVDVAAVNTLSLSPMNISEQTWGMAVLRPRANLTGQSATLLAFGDVTLRNARQQRLEVANFTDDFPPFETLTLTGESPVELNIRSGPSTNFFRVAFLPPNREVLVFGRSQDNMWLRIQLNPEVVGWVSADFLTLNDGSIADLPIVSDEALPPVSLQLIEIGDTVEAIITNQVYEYRYAFAGLAGDVIDLTMQAAISGTLDSYLVLQNEAGDILASSNDSLALDNFTDSQIAQFTLPETATYFVTATRFLQAQGFSAGTFTLSVDYTNNLNFLVPMQALDMESHTPLQRRCMRDDIPRSGVVIQSPEVNLPVVFRINGLQLEVAGTVFLDANRGNTLRLYTLEGHTRAENLDSAQFIPAGSRLSIPLSINLQVTEIDETPQPYATNVVAELPTNVLTRKLEPAPPIDLEAINNDDVVITLDWEGGADLDLRMVEPDETVIRFGEPSPASGAMVPEDSAPTCGAESISQERITWPHGQPRLGKHLVQVVVFDDCGSEAPINWQLTIQAGDEILLSVKGSGDDSIPFER